MNDKQNLHEDEIDLRELIKVVLKRKKFILGLFFASIIITTVFSFLIPKTYETKVVISSGSLGDEIISFTSTVEIITGDAIIQEIIDKLKIDQPINRLRENISVEQVKDSNSIMVKVHAQYPDLSKKICESITNSYLDDVKKLYSKRKEIYEERLGAVNEYKTQAQSDIAQTEASVRSIIAPEMTVSPEEISKNILLKSIYTAQSKNLADLEKQEMDIKLVLANAKDFKVINRFEPERVKSKIKFNITLACILSLMLGIFLAFFMEFWQKGNLKTP